MRFLGVGATSAEPSQQVHPSAPIPVTGPGVGENVRVSVGDTGLSVFPLMLGTGEFGWNVDQRTANDILDRYVDFGGNAVHTADGFSAGRSEHIVGQWIAAHPERRDRLVLAARVGGHADNPGLGSVNLVRAVEATLSRLGVDHLDVLYLDPTADDEPAHLEDTLATAEWLRDAGKFLSLGAYCFTAERLIEARILSAAGYPRIEVVDEPYNLMRRTAFEGDLRLVTSAQSLTVTPSQALEHGFLSGHHRSKTQAGRSVRGEQLRSSLNRRGIRVLRALDAVAEELQVAVAAVAIAWLRAQRHVAAPVVNAFETGHIDELMPGAGISLTRVQLAELSRASA